MEKIEKEGKKVARLIVQSYEYWLGKSLFEVKATTTDQELFEKLYQAPFVVLAHDHGEEPTFTFANATAQRLWQYTWDEFIGMPSKYSAEPQEMADRKKFLDEVQEKGFATNYEGIRIAKDGTRFRVQDITLLNLIENGEVVGQTAIFSSWETI